MAGLQRSEISFRRQGSSGLVWEDRLGEFKKEGSEEKKEEEAGSEFRELRPSKSVGGKSMGAIKMVKTIERSRSTGGGGGGGGGFRTGKVTPSLDPPSPKLSGCCGVFGKPAKKSSKQTNKRKSGKANK